jgi:hypothetical protein
MWDLWWTKWHWHRFFPEYFGFSLSISFHLGSITRKNEKLIIFITGLHNKPQGCSASVASAAGPFTIKKTRISHVLDKKLILTNYKNDLKLDHVSRRLEEKRFIEEQKETFYSDTRQQKNSISESCIYTQFKAAFKPSELETAPVHPIE